MAFKIPSQQIIVADMVRTVESSNEFKDPYVESYKKWKKDQDEYDKNMKDKLLVPEGKELPALLNDYFDGCPTIIGDSIDRGPKCDCGIAKTYKKPTLRMHSDWCELRKDED